MKKFFIILIIITQISFFQVINAENNLPCAKSSIVMDVNTGRILYSSNSALKLPMASTTKIMTVLLAIENCDLNDIVTVSRNASIQEGSSVYLREGERMRLSDLLYCVMLRSGNDAAVAVAEHISGSVEDFAELMNNRAKTLGAKNTNFMNPHGLPNDNHYTTSYDLALITREALKNKIFADIVKTKKHTVSELINEKKYLENKNKMLWQYPGGDGVKTGYTGKAGQCLVSSATKDSWQILSVVLNCSDIWKGSTELLNYGFSNYDNIKVVDKSKIKINVNVLKGKEKAIQVIPKDDLYAPIKKIDNDYEKLDHVENLPKDAKAPVKKNSKAGTLEIYADNFLLGHVDLIYNKDVESSDIFYHLKNIVNTFLL
ncbi:MAG: D-alanyl-D-alanine carboxypeptidase [Firmicutes bacterium]|nr:D-alanyl-D-alanine carboxypeptidase [Bacillota bacterium]